jgi:hypothetical protein
MKSAIIKIDLENLVKSGKFPPFTKGMSKQEIENLGIIPEGWLSEKTKETSAIWLLGNFELHFDENNLLDFIFNDHIPRLITGKQLSIKSWWILPKKKKERLKASKIKINQVIKELHKMKIDYEKILVPPGYIQLKLKNGVNLMFDHPSDKPDVSHNRYTLTVITTNLH